MPRVPLLIAVKICAPLPAFTRLRHVISSSEVLAKKVRAADTRIVSGVAMLTRHPVTVADF